jgi:tripartite-type tricarboxylate transporter receptor subunit TctC
MVTISVYPFMTPLKTETSGEDFVRNISMAVMVTVMLCCNSGAAAATRPGTSGNYPNRPVRFIIPFTPGGGQENMARIIAHRLTQALGTQVVIDNRPGAGTVLGTSAAAVSQPDGHTLLAVSPAFAINQGLRAQLPYNVIRDFSGITQTLSQPYVLAVNPAFPGRTVMEFVGAAKRKSGGFNYASAGIGSGGHLAMELLKQTAKIDMQHIPYKGNALAITDLVAGRVEAVMGTFLSVVPFIKNEKLRALAVSSAKRASILSEVPTISESGLRGYEASSWYGIVVPAKTPAVIVARLNSEVVKALQTQEAKDYLVSNGAEAVGNSATEFGAFIRNETAKWSRVIKTSGITEE